MVALQSQLRRIVSRKFPNVDLDVPLQQNPGTLISMTLKKALAAGWADQVHIFQGTTPPPPPPYLRTGNFWPFVVRGLLNALRRSRFAWPRIYGAKAPRARGFCQDRGS
jgi:hypothetical protein